MGIVTITFTIILTFVMSNANTPHPYLYPYSYLFPALAFADARALSPAPVPAPAHTPPAILIPLSSCLSLFVNANTIPMNLFQRHWICQITALDRGRARSLAFSLKSSIVGLVLTPFTLHVDDVLVGDLITRTELRSGRGGKRQATLQ